MRNKRILSILILSAMVLTSCGKGKVDNKVEKEKIDISFPYCKIKLASKNRKKHLKEV
ncbi:hypothetical protein [Parvimonas parva]|uniref:Lipoprotein n=1 Tax=Parvimonas parva TaxID=2769485 RepID=A0ABS1CAR6_9FIRM|nr:hypothetical protein [Parvimonas parva]MBK1469130.1 hypothetical protein [Parvimonas parva]